MLLDQVGKVKVLRDRAVSSKRKEAVIRMKYGGLGTRKMRTIKSDQEK